MVETWHMPESFPDLSHAKALSLDIETRDDNLKARGPGVREGAYIVGVAIATSDLEFCCYYPIAHDEGANLNKNAVLGWLKEELSRSNQPKIGANLLYDLDFLEEAGVKVNGQFLDIQNAEPLIDENSLGGYGLGDLAKKYLSQDKLIGSLEEALAEREINKKQARSGIWQLPASVVGPYAMQDVILPVQILRKQFPILRSEGVMKVFNMECALIPLLLQMRRTGVRIDFERLNKVIKEFQARKFLKEQELYKLAGFEVQYWAAASVQTAFQSAQLEYPLTAITKKPSFTKDFMKSHSHPLPRLIEECRTLDKFITTFLIGAMQNKITNGRIHALFNQLRGDEFGTVSGRFSSSHPNLQNVPVKDPELGPLCRSMFLPEEECSWGKVDYNQIEFRIFAHFSRGLGADEFRKKYSENPDVDYHQWCADKAGITRKAAKHINFGLIYGMGVKLLSESLNLNLEEAKEFINDYTSKMPFMRETQHAATEAAANKGFIRTLMGRKRRFPFWEPSDRILHGLIPYSKDQNKIRDAIALRAATDQKDYSLGVQRSGTYKALNAVVQGSAADLMKKAMVDCYKAGIFNILTPHLTIHDELDVSIPNNKEGLEAFQNMVDIMENAMILKVPIVAEATIGKWWGESDDRSSFDKKSKKKPRAEDTKEDTDKISED